MMIVGNNESCIGLDGTIHELVVIRIYLNEIEMIVWTKEHHIPALQNSVENSFCKVWSEETLQYFFILANNLIGNTKHIGSRQYGQPYASVRAMNTEALYETVGVENDTHNVPT